MKMRAARWCAVVLCACVFAASVVAQATTIEQAGRVEVLFRPGDPVDERIVAAIDAAKRHVHVLTYAFTHPGIARALLDAHRRGVDVAIVADQAQALELPHSALATLRRRGVPVWLDAGPGSAHNKVIVIDPAGPAAITVTGSFNFTRAAQARNAENVVIFRGNRDVARLYEQYFQRRRAMAQPAGDTARSQR